MQRVHIKFFHDGICARTCNDDFYSCHDIDAPTGIQQSGKDDGYDTDYERILLSVWKSFGHVSDPFYCDDFSFAFISYSSHEEAESAILGINNDDRLKVAIYAAIQEAGGRDRELAKIVTTLVFPNGHARASLARLRPVDPELTGYHSSSDIYEGGSDIEYPDNDYGYDEYDDYGNKDRFDDCPDGIKREEWDAYCEGRGS